MTVAKATRQTTRMFGSTALTRVTRALALITALASTPLAAVPALAEQAAQQTVLVKRGDTLVKIAKRHGVSVADLRRWNRGRIGRADAIRAGDALVVRPGRVAPPEAGPRPANPRGRPLTPPPGTWEDHVLIRRGDSLGKIAARARVDLDALMHWNGLNARSKIKAGERLKIFRPGPRPTPQSLGRPTAGALEHGQYLGAGPGYRLRFPKNAYGVEGVLKTLRTCAKRVKDQHPGSHDILVGDISRPGGGRFPPHSSHQSGRDADVGYYLASQQQNVTMHRVRAHEVDYLRTWALLRCYLTTDKVVRVYIDREIQAAMVRWMRERKVLDERQLGRLFQTEGGDDALIRHAPSHDTHLHVRFACDAGQGECVEEERDSVFSL